MPDERTDFLLNLSRKEMNRLFLEKKIFSFLLSSRNLSDYSIRDRILIRRQCPSASDVRSFEDWKKIGRNVQYGSHGIHILVPELVKSRKPVRRNVDGSVEYGIHEQIRFGCDMVFDISQTEGKEPVVSSVSDLPPDYKLIYQALTDLFPCSIRYEEMSRAQECVLDHNNHALVLRMGMTDLENITVILREWIRMDWIETSQKEDFWIWIVSSLVRCSLGLAPLPADMRYGKFQKMDEEIRWLTLEQIETQAIRLDQCLHKKMEQISDQKEEKEMITLEQRLEGARRQATLRIAEKEGWDNLGKHSF